MRHAGHVAVSIKGIGLGRPADRGLAQAVVNLARFKEAGFVVVVTACPITILGLMDQMQEIPDLIVLVLLGIAPHGLTVIGVRQVDPELVVPRSLRLRRLPDVLTAGGLDQAVNGVIGVVRMGFDHLIVEVDRLLSIVADGSDVTRRVVGVGELLQMVHATQGLEMDQAEGQTDHSHSSSRRRCHSR